MPAARSRSSSCASFDDSYFYQNYVPLSNLPTPPLGHSNSTTRPSSLLLLFPNEPLAPALLGPAIHLTNLIPSSTSLITPSRTTVHAILTRADLPIEILALAACILDSLTSRFALTWRLGCPLNTPTAPPAPPQEPHIDNVHPEVLVLSALILGSQFLDDLSSCTQTYARDWGCSKWSCEQINFTQRCLLENIGYSLLPLCEESIIKYAVRDMERAARRWETAVYNSARDDHGSDSKTESKGMAVSGPGAQITPAETPTLEKTCLHFVPCPEQFSGRWELCGTATDTCG